MSDISVEDMQHMTHIVQDLESAFKYLYDYVPTHKNQITMYWAYIRWHQANDLTTYYHWSMWAATNRDLLAEWVLEFCIREWGM